MYNHRDGKGFFLIFCLNVL